MAGSGLIEYQQYILVNYLQVGNPGPVLKKIAEDRIKWLEESKDVGSKKKPTKYVHLPTGREFQSVLDAAFWLDISSSVLYYDISKEKYEYNIFKL